VNTEVGDVLQKEEQEKIISRLERLRRERPTDQIIKDLKSETDTYLTRLLKYVPAEVIALYLTLDAIIRSSQEIHLFIYWFVFVFGIIGTYFSTYGELRK
jgi:hypothetical protein